MKKLHLTLALLLLCLSSLGSPQIQTLRTGFLTPPPGGGAQTWWHWTSPFVTRVGITADLEAMKAIGYEGAHLFFTSSSPFPAGKYPELLTPEWFELLDFAATQAKRLGLVLGVHNCPGWSLSGGPWIKPEQAMQMIVCSETKTRSGLTRTLTLPQPEVRNGYYRDICVLAFPNANRTEKPELSADFTLEHPEYLLDDDASTYIRLPIQNEGTQATLNFTYQEPYSPQFIELSFGEIHLFVKGRIEASRDGITYLPAAEFDYKIRTDLRLPKCIHLNKNAEGARHFRVTFAYRPYRTWMKPAKVELRGVRFLASSMVTDVDTRNSAMEDNYSFKPFSPDYISRGIDPKQMIDLTDKLQPDGTLTWSSPPGFWTILRIGHTPTGKENGPSSYRGLECDKLSRRGLDAHWPAMMGRIGNALRHTDVLKYAIIDSYEAGGQNWTPDFEAEFLKRRGYALKPYLPVVIGFVVDSPAKSARFLYDFQHTIAELMAENYYDYFTELCHRDSLQAITESYFGPFDYLRCARRADLNTGEFWVDGGTPISRMPGSAAHFHGRARVGAESFTTDPLPGRWQQDPQQLKQYGDAAWIQGVTQLVMHSYVHQPYLNVRPGMTLSRHGSHLSRTNTWWPYGHGWVQYINRSQYLLQQGLPVADMLVLSGESAPNNYPKNEEFLSAGYNYDYCCVDDLREFVEVKQGRIVAPSGVSYACLSLGPDRYLSLATLRKVIQLLRQGATVAGLRPLGSPSLSDSQAEYDIVADQLWGAAKPGAIRTVGKGRLLLEENQLQIARRLQIEPDVVLPHRVDALHRRLGETEIYFVYNDSTRYVNQEARFLVAENKVPELWSADEGTMEPVAVWRREGNQVVMPLSLVPRQSLFVVFRPAADAPHLLQATLPAAQGDTLPPVTTRVIDNRVRLLFSKPARVQVQTQGGRSKRIEVKSVPAPIDLSGNWQVNFPPELGAPDSIHLDRLASLSTHAQEGVRYFSGTAHYQRTFTLPSDWKRSSRRVVLDLGRVRNLAEVRINGRKVALLWKQPFSVEIDNALQAGENLIEIEVTTLWVNRLIGDERNPVVAPQTNGWPDWVLADKANSGLGHYTFPAWKGWRATDPLQDSGLIGPVQLRCLEMR